MTHGNSGFDISLPESVTEKLVALDDETLREVIDFAQNLLDERSEPTTRIEDRTDGEVVSTSEHHGYTLVTKEQRCADGCNDCPHGPYLYRVRIEPAVSGDDPSLHWSFLGRVEE